MCSRVQRILPPTWTEYSDDTGADAYLWKHSFTLAQQSIMVSKVSLIAVLSLAVVAFAGKLSFTPIAAPSTTQYTYGGFSRFNVDGKNYNVSA